MSVEGDNTTVEVTELCLLKEILLQIKILTAIIKEVTGEEITKDDINE